MSSVQSCSEEARSPRRCRRQRTVVTIFQLKNKYFDEKTYHSGKEMLYQILFSFCFFRLFFSQEGSQVFFFFFLCVFSWITEKFFSFFVFSCWAERGSLRTCRQRSAVKILQAQNRAAGSES